MILKKLPVKHLFTLLLAGSFAIPAEGKESDTVVYKNDEKTFVIKQFYTEENRMIKKGDFFGDFFIDLGANRLGKSNMFTGYRHESAEDFPKLNYNKSVSFSMTCMVGWRFTRSLSILSGLGIDWVNYRFSQDVTIKEIDGVATKVPISDVINSFSHADKSKLTAAYLNVPLLMQFSFHNFFISAGINAGVNIGSHTKIVFNNDRGRKDKYKNYDVHPSIFRYGYTVRAGCKNFSLFAHYYTTPLFARNEGPQVYPFAVGISFSGDAF
jgi:hypothetical protein